MIGTFHKVNAGIFYWLLPSSSKGRPWVFLRVVLTKSRPSRRGFHISKLEPGDRPFVASRGEMRSLRRLTMNNLHKLLRTGALAAVLAAAATAATSTSATAEIVCNRYGDCWHASQRYTTYPSVLGIQFYSDDWRAKHSDDSRYHWRDDPKDDHGYYERGEWHAFDEHH